MWAAGDTKVVKKYNRKYPRIHADFPVEYTLGDQTFRDRASDVGGGGLFLNLKRLLPLGTELEVRFRAAKHLPVMKAKARVCYQVPDEGIALELTEISAEHRRKILKLIHRKNGENRNLPHARLAAQIQCEQSQSLAFGKDISLDGMFIETSHPLAIGSRLNLRFNLNEHEPILELAAEVTYEVGKLGVGVQFMNASPEALRRIENYVAKSETLHH
jgi:c-di-GMP-binding flagellar brake protein YcgR